MSEPDITDGTLCVFIDAIADNDSALVIFILVFRYEITHRMRKLRKEWEFFREKNYVNDEKNNIYCIVKSEKYYYICIS